jgi:SNF2 family DNA or RNA helicase
MHDKFLLADDQGLGKTLQSLVVACIRKRLQGFKHCLIVCGYNTLKHNWLAEIEKHTHEQGFILGTRINKKGEAVISSIEDRLKDLTEDRPEFFLITNIETVRYAKKIPYGKKHKRDFVAANLINSLCGDNIGMIIYDEWQTAINASSLQANAMLRINPPIKIAASGTPIVNRSMDSFTLLKWLDAEPLDYMEYRNRYCIMGGFAGKEIVGEKNIEEIHEKLKPRMLRRKKEDVLDLPEKVLITEMLEMPHAQAVVYNNIRKGMLGSIETIRKNKNLLDLLYLRECTSHPLLLDCEQLGSIEEVNQLSDSVLKSYQSVKFDRLGEIIADIVAAGEKAIVFSNWARLIRLVNRQFNNYNPAIIIGEVKNRQEQVNKFQHDKECSIICGTIKAMGTGLTLTAANHVIWIDQPWNQAFVDQGIDRAHRIGTVNRVMVRTLLCRGTLDPKINELIQGKGRIADMIVDGAPRNYDALINYLFDLD